MRSPTSRSFALRLVFIVALSAIAAAVYFWFGGQPSHQSSAIATTSLGEGGAAKPDPSLLPAARRDAGGAANQIPESSTIAKPQKAGAIDGRTLAMCRRALIQKKYMERFNCDKIKADDAVGLRICQDALVSNYADVQRLAAESAPCPEELAVASVYYKALRDGALGGDDNARRCFIQGYFDDLHSRDVISQEQTSEYVSLAGKLIESSIEGGDWGVVRWLGRYRLQVEDGMLRRAYSIGSEHPDTVYRMNFLLQLSGR